MIGAIFSTWLAFIAPLSELTATQLQPDCRGSIERQCEAVVALERAACESAFYAHCHVEEAGRRVGESDMSGGVSELKLASARYDTLFRLTAPAQLEVLADLLIRYADAIAMVFTPGQLAGEGPVMEDAANYLCAGYQRLLELHERRPAVARLDSVRRISETVAEHCRDLLEDLGRGKLREAMTEQKSAALAEGLAATAASRFMEARRVFPGPPEREAVLLKAQISAQLSAAEFRRKGRQQSERAGSGARDLCVAHRRMLAELEQFRGAHRPAWDRVLEDLRARVAATVSQCTGRRHLLVGAGLASVGAVALGSALGLYLDYDRDCARNAMDHCTGIGPDDPMLPNDEHDRATRQVHAALGLAFVGGAMLTVSVPLLAVGGRRGAPLHRRVAHLAPIASPTTLGGVLTWQF